LASATRTAPYFSVKKMRPSGAKAIATGKFKLSMNVCTS